MKWNKAVKSNILWFSSSTPPPYHTVNPFVTTTSTIPAYLELHWSQGTHQELLAFPKSWHGLWPPIHSAPQSQFNFTSFATVTLHKLSNRLLFHQRIISSLSLFQFDCTTHLSFNVVSCFTAYYAYIVIIATIGNIEVLVLEKNGKTGLSSTIAMKLSQNIHIALYM